MIYRRIFAIVFVFLIIFITLITPVAAMTVDRNYINDPIYQHIPMMLTRSICDSNGIVNKSYPSYTWDTEDVLYSTSDHTFRYNTTVDSLSYQQVVALRGSVPFGDGLYSRNVFNYVVGGFNDTIGTSDYNSMLLDLDNIPFDIYHQLFYDGLSVSFNGLQDAVDQVVVDVRGAYYYYSEVQGHYGMSSISLDRSSVHDVHTSDPFTISLINSFWSYRDLGHNIPTKGTFLLDASIELVVYTQSHQRYNMSFPLSYSSEPVDYSSWQGELIDESYDHGVYVGYNDGYGQGNKFGYDSGYSEGYRIGFNEGELSVSDASKYSFIDFLLVSLGGFFNTPIFNHITLGEIFGVIIGVAVTIFFLKVVAGG